MLELRIRLALTTLTVVVVAGVAAASTLELQPGHFLVQSDYQVVEIDDTGDVIAGFFAPFLAYGVALSAHSEILTLAQDCESICRHSLVWTDASGDMLHQVEMATWFDRVAVDPNGDLLLGHGNLVYRVGEDGDFIDVFSLPVIEDRGGYIVGLAVDADGNVYGAISAHNSPDASIIAKVDPNGALLSQTEVFDLVISGLTVSEIGDVYFARSYDDQYGSGVGSEITRLDSSWSVIDTFPIPVERIRGLDFVRAVPEPRTDQLAAAALVAVTLLARRQRDCRAARPLAPSALRCPAGRPSTALSGA